jgi:hypothetical protein
MFGLDIAIWANGRSPEGEAVEWKGVERKAEVERYPVEFAGVHFKSTSPASFSKVNESTASR